MLRIDNIQTIEGITVYGDDEDFTKFYLVPDEPRFRINENGRPAFSFLKYRNPIERTDGEKGGGFLICDVEFTVTPEKQEAVVKKLQEQINQLVGTGTQPPQVKIGTITYSRGTAKLNLESFSDQFIETVFNPGKPSLYGRNITPFSVELTDRGATMLETALQNKGGFVQVTYDLYCPVKLPPVKAHIWFNSSKFMSFAQDLVTNTTTTGFFVRVWRWLFTGRTTTKTTVEHNISEIASQSDWGGVDLDFGDFKASDELKQKIRDWAWNTLAEAIKNATTDPIKAVSEEQRKPPANATEFHQRISSQKFSNVDYKYRESQVVEWNLAPQGTLEPIVNLKDKSGNPLRWEDFAVTVNLDDPFFRTLEVPIRVNGDFKELPIHSVEVHCDYQEGSIHEIKEFSISSPDQLEKFKSYIENNKWTYKYWYQVNYRGQSQIFKSKEIETDEKFLTINVGDTGILAIDIQPGDLNWSQVNQAQVKLKYDARDNGSKLIERVYVLDKNNPKHSLREVIFTPITKPYSYHVKYFMADGKEYEVSEATSESPQLFINDPFGATKTISLRAAGDLDNDIQTIFVDIKYIDEKNTYVKNISIALDKARPFFDWSFPAIDEMAGKIVYKGSIQFKNGQVEDIPEQTTKENTILVGSKVEDVLEIEVIPTLIDFTKVSLITVSLKYVDEENDVRENRSMTFNASANTPQTWKLSLKDKNKTKYQWSARFFMADTSKREIAPQETEELTLVLQVPST